jgi:hypothetical protein
MQGSKREFRLQGDILHETTQGRIAVTFTSATSAYARIGYDGAPSVEIRGVAYTASAHLHVEDGRFVSRDSRGHDSVTMRRVHDMREVSPSARKAMHEFIEREVNLCADANPEALHEAEARAVNNDLHRVEEEIGKLEKSLNELHARRDALLEREAALAGGGAPAPGR